MSLWDDLERSSGIERTNKPGLWSDIKRSTGQIIESTGSAVRDALPSVGGAIEDVGAGIVRRNPSQINTWEDIKSKPLTTAREAIGEVAPQIGTTLGGGLAGRYVGGVIGGALGGPLGAIAGQQVGAAAGAYLPNLIQEYGGIRKEQRDQGIDDKGRALAAGAGAAVLDTALGTERLATKVLGKGSDILARQAGTSLLKNVGKQAAIGGATEAVTEVGQTGIERWGAKKDLLSPDAMDEYAVAGVKGGIGGGAIRGGIASIAGEQPVAGAPTPAAQPPAPAPTQAPAPASGGEIQQAMQQGAGKTYTAPNGSIYTQTADGKWEVTTPAPAAPVTPPIVQGGTTAVAQGAQAVDAENNAIAAAQQQQAKREEVMTTWGIADPQNPTKGQFFGQPVFGTTVPAIADAWGAVTQTMTPVETELAQAVATAHADTGNKLISFKLSADKPQQTAQKAGESIKKVLTKFQIADVASVEEAASRLNEQSKTLTGGQLDQVNAIHSALTGGEDTVGYIESQKSEAEKKAAKTKPAAAPAPVVQQPASAPVPADANALVQEQPNGQASQASAAAPVDQGTAVGQQQPQPAADAGLPAGAADQTGQAVQGAGVSEVDAGDAGEARHLTSLRRALDIVIPPHPRQTEDARQGRIQFLLDRYTETYDNLGAVHDDKLSEYAKEYGVSLSTIKRWSASLKKLDKQKLLAAVETAAREQGISLEDVKESWRQAIAETQQKIEALEAQQNGEPEDSGQSTSRAEDGPLESDNVEYKDDTEAESQDEGAPSEDSVDRNNDGLSEKGRLESLQERGNARDRLAAEYVRVSNKLDKAELNGEDEEAAKLSARLREIEDEIAGLNQKEQRANAKDTKPKSDKPTAPKEDKPKSKGARVVKKPAAEVKPAEPDLRTDEEKAAAAWDKVAAQYPSAPKFADLTEEQRETFVEYGEENWTEDDVKNELVKLAKTRAVASKDLRKIQGQKRDLGRETDTRDLDGVEITEVDLSMLEDLWDSFGSALDSIRESGLDYLVRRVATWHVAYDADFAAAFTLIDGKPAIVVNPSLNPASDVEWNITHELGHLADHALVGSEDQVFSSHSLMSVLRATDGSITATGEVAREVVEYAKNNPQSGFAATMRYPLAREKMKRMDTQAEIFAQLWAMWNTENGRAFMQQNLPLASTFIETAYEQTKAQQNGAGQAVPDSARRREAARAVQRQAATLQGQRAGAVQVRQSAAGNVPFRLNAQAVDKLPEPLKAPVKATWTNLFTYAKQGALALAITEDVVNLAAKYTSGAKDYLAAQFKRQGIRLDFEAKVEDIVRSFEKLSKREQEAVNKLIYDSTRSEKWAYVPTWGAQNRKITVDTELAARHSVLSDEAKKVIDATFEHGHNALAAKQDAVRDLLARQFDALEAAAKAANDTEALAEVQKERSQLEARFQNLLKIKENKPYAYLGRYGNYVAVAKSAEFIQATKLAAGGDKDAIRWLEKNQSNEDHYIVSFAETPAEAAALAAQWRATDKYEKAFARVKLEEAGDVGGNDLVMAVSRLKNLVERKGEVLDEKVFKAVRSLMGELYLQVAAEGSARKTEMQRKNIAGADINMMRNLATSGRADAHFIAGLETNDEITKSISKMEDDIRDGAGEGAEYVNELIKRYANSLEYTPPGPLSSMLNKLGITYFLSTNPAFYLQQMLQTAVLTQPYMSGTLGYWNSKRQIEGAYKDLFKMVKGLGLDDRIDFTKAPDDVRVMLQTLTAQGKIDLGIEAEARAMAHEKGVLNTVHRKLGHVNTRIESINRAVAAIAAYRGHLQKFGDAAKATAYAAEVVQNTHGNYDGFNTPRAFANDVGRVIGQFKRFQIIQLSMLAKLLHTSFKGASPDERLVARKALGFIVGHMAALGGVLGVPFVTQLGNILLSVFGDDEEPDDLEYALRKAIGDDAVADLLLRGAPSLVGLESLGKKVAMENVASILPFTDVGSLDRDGMTKILVGLMGPSAALSLKAADAFSLMSQGYLYKGMEQLLPNGFANAMKGARFAAEGITQRNGDVVMPPEDISILDATFQALGLPTDTISDRQRTQRLVKEFDDFYAAKAESIKRDYVRAFEKGDSEDMADARQAWQELQDARVKNGYTRIPISTLFKAPQEKAKRERNVANGVEYRKQNKQFVESL